jgi:hypothetical protein
VGAVVGAFENVRAAMDFFRVVSGDFDGGATISKYDNLVGDFDAVGGFGNVIGFQALR